MATMAAVTTVIGMTAAVRLVFRVVVPVLLGLLWMVLVMLVVMSTTRSSRRRIPSGYTCPTTPG